jgi:hypothetical protein
MCLVGDEVVRFLKTRDFYFDENLTVGVEIATQAV